MSMQSTAPKSRTRTTRTAAPKITPRTRTPKLAETRLFALESEGNYDSRRFFDQHADGETLDATLGTFLDCSFEDMSAGALVLDQAHVSETSLSGCGLARLHMVGALLADCSLTGCRLGSVDAMESVLRSVEFKDCRIGYLNLRDAKWRDVRFENCAIDEFDGVGAQLTRLSFAGCQINSINLQHATVSNVDLRDARLARIEGVEYLRGTTMSLDQIADLAAAFAESLGIRTL
ncbi:pentapeptide repeat-containing protein [Bifidobacterium canis]|uniref:Pentapeptide repeats (9 copies) n=1 Tax=Bifidobacterium canis TaxID=2610880 RepID=A0A7K1J4Z5_9BIFI|nr:pentapeptide repeat-containing protein [Bifidobacterium canis]MUH59662.1 Pentapeptide repeats (9 copies) [Bifidobacterium canis]